MSYSRVWPRRLLAKKKLKKRLRTFFPMRDFPIFEVCTIASVIGLPPSSPLEFGLPTQASQAVGPSQSLNSVESRCGAVAVGRTYLLPPLSFGGASLVRPWLRLHTYRVTGGSRPPPVPTERGVRISRTNALRQLLHSTASACSSRYWRRSLGVSNGVRSLIRLKASQVRRRPAQLPARLKQAGAKHAANRCAT